PLDPEPLPPDAQLVARLDLALLEPEEDAVLRAAVLDGQLLAFELEDRVRRGDELVLVELHFGVAHGAPDARLGLGEHVVGGAASVPGDGADPRASFGRAGLRR